MKTLQERYLDDSEPLEVIEHAALPFTRRLLAFLYEVNPEGYVEFGLEGEDEGPAVGVEEYHPVVTPDTEGILFFGPKIDEDHIRCFVLPFAYVDDPDAFEAHVLADMAKTQDLVNRFIAPTFGIENDAYEIIAYPSHWDKERYLNVHLHHPYERAILKPPVGHVDDEEAVHVLEEIIDGCQNAFLYDKYTNTLYNHAKPFEPAEIPRLIEEYPWRAKKYVFDVRDAEKRVKQPLIKAYRFYRLRSFIHKFSRSV